MINILSTPVSISNGMNIDINILFLIRKRISAKSTFVIAINTRNIINCINSWFVGIFAILPSHNICIPIIIPVIIMTIWWNMNRYLSPTIAKIIHLVILLWRFCGKSMCVSLTRKSKLFLHIHNIFIAEQNFCWNCIDEKLKAPVLSVDKYMIS